MSPEYKMINDQMSAILILNKMNGDLLILLLISLFITIVLFAYWIYWIYHIQAIIQHMLKVEKHFLNAEVYFLSTLKKIGKEIIKK